MKQAKKWFSLLLAAIMAVASPLSAFAAWEDGLVIPGQSSGNYSGGYDDLFWEYTDSGSYTIDSGYSSVIEYEGTEKTTESDEDSGDTIDASEDIVIISPFSLRDTGESSTAVTLAENYAEIYGTDSMPKARSATGSDPHAYLTANGGYVTITADRPLNNILHYDGVIVDNIHIAKWVADDPAELEYPAYCKNPGWKGTAQHNEGQYQVDPLDSFGAEEKKLLGIARAGYPYKTPAQLGCNNVEEAYYATHGAIHTAIVNGSLDKWSIQSGDTARNTRVLNALKQIYNEGIANPYTPPEYSGKLSPVNGSETASEEGEWVVNTYSFESDVARDKWKFRIMGDDVMALVDSGSIEVYAGSTKLTPQTNISGAWDTNRAFLVSMGTDVTVKVKKSLAESTGIDFTFFGTTVGGTFDTAVSYLGDPVNLTGNWQGYIYNFRPQVSDQSRMTYNKVPIPDEPKDPDDPTPPETPDTPTSSSDGSLLVEKLDYNTKAKAKDAVFHIRGISDSCNHINITVKASNGATAPVLGNGAKVELSDGVVKMTGIPVGAF